MYREMRDRSCGRARWLSRMLASCAYPTPLLLALFLLDLAAGLVVFLPLVGRRNAGVKFYRLVLVISGALSLCALVAHFFARRRDLVMFDETLVVCTVWVLMTLRYPKRLVFR